MNDAEDAILTFKREAQNYTGKDAVYRRIKSEMEERISRFSRRLEAMKGRAETHAKLAETLYEESFNILNITVKGRNGEELVKYNITTMDDVREHLTKAKMLFENGIKNDIDYLNAMIEEQEAVGEHLPD